MYQISGMLFLMMTRILLSIIPYSVNTIVLLFDDLQMFESSGYLAEVAIFV